MGKVHKIRKAFWREVEASGSDPMPRYTSAEVSGTGKLGRYVYGKAARRRVQVKVTFGRWYWSRHSYEGLLRSLYREYFAIQRF